MNDNHLRRRHQHREQLSNYPDRRRQRLPLLKAQWCLEQLLQAY
jgi:hypothetical protein